MTAHILSFNKPTESKAYSASFLHMKKSMRSADMSLAERIKMAKVLATLLSDKSSNEEHLACIRGNNALNDKVLAVIMLGFPDNLSMLKTLRDLLSHPTEELKIAATIAIAQMKNGKNDKVLSEILLSACQENHSVLVKLSLKKAIDFLNKKPRTLLVA